VLLSNKDVFIKTVCVQDCMFLDGKPWIQLEAVIHKCGYFRSCMASRHLNRGELYMREVLHLDGCNRKSDFIIITT